jgi:hypothetical protein
MKTLAVILHYNTPQYTDVLYELLEPEQLSGNYDLVVIDNGSDVGKESKYATYKLNENVFFGGGLNASMNLILDNDEYDSLLFLNSDLIVGKRFVTSLRYESGIYQDSIKYDIISPCIIQPEKTQNHWNQMLPNSLIIREVKWIDLQAPFISRRFIEHLASEVQEGDNIIDGTLIRGWGIDVWFGIEAKRMGWRTGVSDVTPAVHLGSMTMKALGNVSEYCQLAEQGMNEFFNKSGLMKEFIDMRSWAENYKI